MKYQLTAIGMVVALGAGGVVSAQSGATGKGQMDKGMMKEGSMTVTGCVTAGKDAGQYMLTNAMMTGGTMDKTMDKDKMQAGMSGRMMSYELVGGDNLRAHMGQKVEVVGSLSKSDMEKMRKMGRMDKMDEDKMGKAKMGGMSDKDMNAMKLNVKSVKMVSASCP